MGDYWGNNYFAPRYFAEGFWGYSGVISGFPTQYGGLFYFDGVAKELCLVGLGDAPGGDRVTISKNGTLYALYLVDPADPDASNVRLKTSDGVKSVRLKT